MAAAGDVYVVDIETVGEPWASLDEPTQQSLLRRAGTDAEKEAVPRRLGLDPGTGRIIVIGMLNVTAGTGGVFVEGRPHGWSEGGPSGFKRFDGSEAEMLAEFWRIVGANARRIVTFNGREFDGPFLMLRSAIHGIAPTRNLAGYRYSLELHCDLADVLRFRGAVHGRFGLDYWCRRFGIPSPKEGGLDGAQVQECYENGGIDEIAAYCVRDVLATSELYQRLEATLLPLFDR